MNGSMFTVFHLDTTKNRVDLVIEMVQDDGRALVRLECFPWIDHEPCRRLLCGEVAHIDAVVTPLGRLQ